MHCRNPLKKETVLTDTTDYSADTGFTAREAAEMMTRMRNADEGPPEEAPAPEIDDANLPAYLRKGDTPAEAVEKLIERR